MDLGLKGKRALVMGGNRGIGFGIAAALAAENADVLISARDEVRLVTAARDLSRLGNGRVETAAVDLRDTARLPAFAKKITAAFGPIDILINNTGGPAHGGVTERPINDWRVAYDGMVLSIVTLTNALLPGMQTRQWGRIVTVISSGVIQPIPILAISNSLRAAVTGWSKTLSSEVAADGITVNTLVPGRIDTESLRALDCSVAAKEGISVERVERRSFETIPLGRYGRIDEIGAAAAFLCSMQASYMTGTMTRVDGGVVRSW